jgi:hypothetical protein
LSLLLDAFDGDGFASAWPELEAWLDPLAPAELCPLAVPLPWFVPLPWLLEDASGVEEAECPCGAASTVWQ